MAIAWIRFGLRRVLRRRCSESEFSFFLECTSMDIELVSKISQAIEMVVGGDAASPQAIAMDVGKEDVILGEVSEMVNAQADHVS